MTVNPFVSEMVHALIAAAMMLPIAAPGALSAQAYSHAPHPCSHPKYRWASSWGGITELGEGAGSLEGYVYDEGGMPLGQIIVRVDGSRLGAVTDGLGHFVIDSIPAGEHVLSLSMILSPADETHEIAVATGHRDLRCFDMRPLFMSPLLDNLSVTGGPYIERHASPRAVSTPVQCLEVPMDVVQVIESGFEPDAGYSLGRVAAVASGAHPTGFFVAAEVRRPGASTVVGLWGFRTLSERSFREAVNEATRRLWPWGSTRSGVFFFETDPGASEALSCIR